MDSIKIPVMNGNYRCVTCGWWKAFDVVNFNGRCSYNSPTAMHSRPITYKTDYCSHWAFDETRFYTCADVLEWFQENYPDDYRELADPK